MSWLSELFGGGGNKNNPANAAMPYLNQIPGATSPYMQPYYNAGTGALPSLQNQYGNLLENPGDVMNKIGQSYQQSPGLKFAIEQAMQGAGHAAAAGGMAGSPQHEQQNMQLSTNLANQDYGNYMQNALGLYGAGLTGQQNLAGMGQHAGQSLMDMIAQTLASQGGYAYAGQAAKNQQRSGMLGNIFGALGAFPGMYGAYKDQFGS